MHESISKIKWFDEKKRYGFIKGIGDQPDIFFHQSVVNFNGDETLKKNQRVEFDCVHGPKGLMATRVERV